jgi:predicted DNA-binding transcriptional regulator YafY
MLELQTKVKRQIEILGLALSNTDAFKDADFAVIFGRDIPTIKRDMKELRGLGIDLHSEKKKGLCVSGHIDVKLLRELITQYIGICNSASGIDRATALLVQKQKEKALSHIVTVQRCIDDSTVAFIDYQKDDATMEKGREVWPLMIFSSESHWRLLAVNEGKIKQYLLTKILGVRPAARRFRRIPQSEIDDMFRYSFRSWVGAEKHHVKIHLSKFWAGLIKPRQLMETEVITENSDGSIVFEATVNSLQEVAGWVVSRGEGVKVLEPKELHEMVVKVARGALANYS